MKYVAVVLAGGAGRRVGGADKTTLALGGGPSALERVLAAVAGAERVVVVGPRRELPGAVQPDWVREEPPGGGPLAAVAAGVAAVDRDLPAPAGRSGPVGGRAEAVLVLAGDMPLVGAAVDALLAAAADGPDGAVLVDAAGVRQPLAAAYRPGWLTDRLAALGDPAGQPVRRLLDGAAVTEVPDRWQASADFDTWPDRDRIEELLRDE